MPLKPNKICNFPFCGKIISGNETYCSSCKRKVDSDYRLTRDKAVVKLYNTRNWKRLRLQVLNEQPLCVECLKADRITPAREVDHKTPHNGDINLFLAKENCQSLCKSCHSTKTGKERK